jgi:nucleoside-diphosphate-sugar epimerase
MVFEGAVQFPSRETDLQTTFIPKTAYGFQKLCGEFMCKAYHDQYGINYTIIRPFNAVGPERPDPDFVGYSHVIPDLILKMHNGQGGNTNPLKILGSGKQVRHYTDVREIAEGLLIAMHSSKGINEDFNVAIDKGHTVIEVARLISQHMRGENEPLLILPEEGFPHDVQKRTPDTSKMEDYFGWKATKTLEDIMPELIENVLDLLEVNQAN